MRIDKFLSEMNIGTRSQVKQLIKKGYVCVNGAPIKKADTHVNENTDSIFVNGKQVVYRKYRYYMLNKPGSVVSAVKDNRDRTVVDLLNPEDRKDIFPVGRLDKDTEGLLLLTNDGELSHNLLSPSKHVEKTYFVIVDGMVEKQHISLFKTGIDIGDDKLTKPSLLEIVKSGNESTVLLTITEGRFHQVKRMFRSIGMNVIYLKRLSMGILKLDEKLSPGEYRKLTDTEITQIGGQL